MNFTGSKQFHVPLHLQILVHFAEYGTCLFLQEDNDFCKRRNIEASVCGEF